ncbi:MAG: isochorismatase family protein [Draconibacterium sp.]
MNLSGLIFWNVDTQVDFVLPEGKLYVPGAELLQDKWERLTEIAKEKLIPVVNTADFHYDGSKELSDNPDFIKTFPAHCMANTAGAEYVSSTNPENPVIFDWNGINVTPEDFLSVNKIRNIIIRKDAFDVFVDNPYTDEIVSELAPETVIVYGVTTNVCVNDAVVGLASRVKNVFVIEDAIKELPNIPLPFDTWKQLGVKMISLAELEEMLEQN